MWTKRNDHAQKMNVLIFVLTYVQKTHERGKKEKRKNSFQTHYNNISLPWALAFFYESTSFGPCQWIMSRHSNMCFRDLILHGHSNIFLLLYTEVIPWRVQQPITDFRALQRLHGPWCKQSLQFKYSRKNKCQH